MNIRILVAIILALGLGSAATAQQPAASPDPLQMQQLPVPAVAPDFRAPQKPLPELNRVGVDMNRQHPLSLREALSLGHKRMLTASCEEALRSLQDALAQRSIGGGTR